MNVFIENNGGGLLLVDCSVENGESELYARSVIGRPIPRRYIEGGVMICRREMPGFLTSILIRRIPEVA